MSDFSIDDLRLCPALAGPDEVVMLLKKFDEQRKIINELADVANTAIDLYEFVIWQS